MRSVKWHIRASHKFSKPSTKCFPLVWVATGKDVSQIEMTALPKTRCWETAAIVGSDHKAHNIVTCQVACSTHSAPRLCTANVLDQKIHEYPDFGRHDVAFGIDQPKRWVIGKLKRWKNTFERAIGQFFMD